MRPEAQNPFHWAEVQALAGRAPARGSQGDPVLRLLRVWVASAHSCFPPQLCLCGTLAFLGLCQISLDLPLRRTLWPRLRPTQTIEGELSISGSICCHLCDASNYLVWRKRIWSAWNTNFQLLNLMANVPSLVSLKEVSSSFCWGLLYLLCQCQQVMVVADSDSIESTADVWGTYF